MSFGSSGPGAGNTSVYLFLAILVLIVIRRLSSVLKGSKVSKARTWAFSAYYVAIAALFALSSFTSGGVSPLFVILYVAIGAAGAYWSYLFSHSRIGFWKVANGDIYYRGAVMIYVIYVAALIARIAIGLVILGPQAFSFAGTLGTTSPSSSAVDASILTDSLLALGAGLLAGRNAKVLKRYSAILEGKETVSDMPPKISLT